MRFTATRGSMSVGQSQGGLPPDAVVEREDAVLKDSQRLIETWHDASHGAMLQVALAPCSPFSVSPALMRESAALARSFKGQGVRLHTHLAENDHDIAYSREKFNKTPAQYAQELGWLGDDVWHAHCVHMSQEEIGLFGRTGTGVAHCPSSNMRLASGICPVLDQNKLTDYVRKTAERTGQDFSVLEDAIRSSTDAQISPPSHCQRVVSNPLICA